MSKLLKYKEFSVKDSIQEKKSTKEVPFAFSGLMNPKKADLNKNKKISGYEKARGKAVEKGIAKTEKKKK